MTSEALGHINSLLTGVGLHYEFMRWTSDLIFPYWVGEYNEIENLNEDGMQESNFILTGTTEGSWLDLETDKATIYGLLKDGYKTVLASGYALAIFYDNALEVPTDTENMKRMQINLTVRTWRNN